MNNLADFLASAFDKVKGMVDVNSIVGSPITTADGTTLIPVTKLSVGMGVGGIDANAKAADGKISFTGGTGAGVTINPVAFIVIKDGNARVVYVNQGEKVVILGASGSGKSTLLRCLNCMEDPTGGSIYFEGVDLADMKVNINLYREHIGMVFQQFNLFNNLKVIENITLAPMYVANKARKKTERKNFFIKLSKSISLKKL